METITTYVNNVFRPLPATPELLKVKDDITNNMLEKYQELIRAGKSEHEAIGIVISEFGNIEELLEELGIHYKEESAKSLLSLETVKEYLNMKSQSGLLITAGVAMCILGVLLTCLFDGLVEQSIFPYLLDSSGDSILGYTSLLICISIAVGLFIYSGYLTKKFDFIQNGVTLTAATKAYILDEKERNTKSNTICIIIGVSLCILSVIVSSIMDTAFGNNDLSNLPMLFLILIAVSLFVYTGCKSSAYDLLLRTPNELTSSKKGSVLYGVVNSIIMLTATAIYLIAGFLFDCWGPSILIFAIGGIACAIASTIIWGCTQKSNTKL